MVVGVRTNTRGQGIPASLKHTRVSSLFAQPVAVYERYASLPLVLTCLGEPSELRQQRCGICIAAQRFSRRVSLKESNRVASGRAAPAQASPLQHRLTAGQTCAARSVKRLSAEAQSGARNSTLVLPPRRRGARRRDRPLRDGRGPLRDGSPGRVIDLGRPRWKSVCARPPRSVINREPISPTHDDDDWVAPKTMSRRRTASVPSVEETGIADEHDEGWKPAQLPSLAGKAVRCPRTKGYY